MKAIELFNRIGSGRENALPRSGDKSVDRGLRELINQANKEGDFIIPSPGGYYRPLLGRPEERAEAEIYLRKELSRARDILFKRLKMRQTLVNMEEQLCRETAS